MSLSFREKLVSASERARSLVCVGLDTDPEKIPAFLSRDSEGVRIFNEAIIRATSRYVCAYKPNAAFYEALGSAGIDMLRKTCTSIPPDIPVILDFKRGDIGNTALHYARYAYDVIGADAVTVNPYMGFDTVRPFFRPGKCVFILCLTSNDSARDFQMLFSDGFPVYERVAMAAAHWAGEGEIGLVVGATKPEALKTIRSIVGDMPILVPGVGAQGGDLGAVIEGCGARAGSLVINSSRSILYASGGNDYAEAALTSLLKLRETINILRENPVT